MKHAKGSGFESQQDDYKRVVFHPSMNGQLFIVKNKHSDMPNAGMPTYQRQKWFIKTSLLTGVTQRSLIKPVDVTKTQVYGKER